MKKIVLSSVLAALVLSACGGGGGSDGDKAANNATVPPPADIDIDARGIYNGTNSNNDTVSGVVLDNGTYYFVYVPVPYLSYTPNAYLGRMTEVIIATAPTRLHLDKVYETDMAEGLKAMALAGHGVAFLPHSAVEDAVEEGRLVRLDRGTRGTPAGQFTLTMEIRLYRDKLAALGEEPRQALMRALWNAVGEELQNASSGRPAT